MENVSRETILENYREELNYDIRPTLKAAVTAMLSKEANPEDVVDCLQSTLARWDRMVESLD